MNLTAEQFEAVLAGMGGSAPSAKADKRRAPRMTHRSRVPINLTGGGKGNVGTVVTLRDFSARGVCFFHTAAMSKGTTFIIRLDGPGGESIRVLGTVVNCRPLSKDLFAVGAEFTRIYDESAALQADRIRHSVLD